MSRLRPLLLSLAALGCASPPPPPEVVAPGPDVVMDGVTLKHVRAGVVQVEATSPHVEYERATGRFVASDAGAALPATGTSVTARDAQGSAPERWVEGSGGVALEGRGQLHAESPRARFDRAVGEAGQASTDAGVRLRRPGVTLEARGVTWDVARDEAVFEAPVTKVERAP